MTNERQTVSVEEAAEILGISRALAYSLVARQELPSLKLGRRVVVPRRALDRLLDLDPSASSSEERGAS
jgi:excisionase family DNA binding protein